MNAERRKRNSARDRERCILEHVARYRLTTLEVLRRVVLPGLTRNAVSKIVNRLSLAGMLQKHTLFYPSNYFVLGATAIHSLGVGAHRAGPLGSQSLPHEFALLAFCTLSEHQHLRLNVVEVRKRCAWLPLSLTTAPHCMDEHDVLELVRVDLGGPADHVARKCVADVSARTRFPEFVALAAAGGIRFVIIAATTKKSATIRRALGQHTWPTGLQFHLSVLPQLLLFGAPDHA